MTFHIAYSDQGDLLVDVDTESIYMRSWRYPPHSDHTIHGLVFILHEPGGFFSYWKGYLFSSHYHAHYPMIHLPRGTIVTLYGLIDPLGLLQAFNITLSLRIETGRKGHCQGELDLLNLLYGQVKRSTTSADAQHIMRFKWDSIAFFVPLSRIIDFPNQHC